MTQYLLHQLKVYQITQNSSKCYKPFFPVQKIQNLQNNNLFKMNNQDFSDDMLDLEWEDDSEDLHLQSTSCIQPFFQYRDLNFLNQQVGKKSSSLMQPQIHSLSSIHFSQRQDSSQQNSTSQKWKRKQHQKKKAKKVQKNQKDDKQRYYVKTYRQRIKQRYINLEEQNVFLKERINDLQNQLKQQETQLNRLKYPLLQKELSIEQLNKQYSELSLNLLDSLKSNPEEYHKLWYEDDNYYHKFFLDFYNQRGFAGKKKFKILNYHFNQILQTVLKDSEKYLSMALAKSKSYDQLSKLPQFQAINKAFYEVFKPEGDLWNRLNIFLEFIHPICLQLNTLISQLYKKFEEVLCCSDKIHNFLKQTYQTNMDIARRRVEMQKWFDFHKYGKTMKSLRYQWFIWMKTLATKKEQWEQQMNKGLRKKKSL